MKIAFVTTNKGKFEEVENLLKSYGVDVEWINRKYEEDNDDTVEDTAKKAAKKLADELKKPIVLEDTGLFFEAYDGFPGPSPKFVFKTLGYKGIFKLLDGDSKKAYFETFAAYCEPDGEPMTFSGKMQGEITTQVFNAEKDFDFMPYDRIFIPEGEDRTISDMTMEEKNQLSQRSKAFREFGEFLKDRNS
ncbi:MAG TPA: RdgB/HAM1 family non-canonical purine NTP pyrophosphatase [Patescibacteria group bacterium]|nr:RdgB/HAM1 family non-canonical purine NTP pyrophosphatase [Patescibacteria group bacterium]